MKARQVEETMQRQQQRTTLSLEVECSARDIYSSIDCSCSCNTDILSNSWLSSCPGVSKNLFILRWPQRQRTEQVWRCWSPHADLIPLRDQERCKRCMSVPVDCTPWLSLALRTDSVLHASSIRRWWCQRTFAQWINGSHGICMVRHALLYVTS